MNNLTKLDYQKQRANAKCRGIDFDLTYEEWLEIWISSGFAHLRGNGIGKYCMGRHNDIGPYSVDNVSIISSQKNSSDSKGSLNYKHTEESKAKIRAARAKQKFTAESNRKRSEAMKRYRASTK